MIWVDFFLMGPKSSTKVRQFFEKNKTSSDGKNKDSKQKGDYN